MPRTCVATYQRVFFNLACCSANTLLAQMTRKHRRAFSLISPLVLSSKLHAIEGMRLTRIKHLLDWAMSARGESGFFMPFCCEDNLANIF